MVVLMGLLLGLDACSSPAGTITPVQTWPVDSEALPQATSEISGEFGPASWALDPSFSAPNNTTTELHILVWERACSGGAPTTGRMSAPLIEYAATTVTIRVGVRPIVVAEGEGVTCPMPPGTPASVRLSEPLRGRTLLDGGHEPPVAPSPANG